MKVDHPEINLMEMVIVSVCYGTWKESYLAGAFMFNLLMLICFLVDKRLP